MNWRYHAAKRRQEEKLRNFAMMYGANPDGLVIRADYSAIEQRILAHMSMPPDRVRFTLDTFTDNATREAFRQAFGTYLIPKSGPDTCVTVVCRPSQFARFLIYRNDNGGKNSFKELRAELFTPEPTPDIIDVSRNPRA